ncbi:MAG: hypothetical protein Q8N18_18875 [Opitutaceae bacterium]|nr:hypothetical protein [Opitutaceae bacterium]
MNSAVARSGSAAAEINRLHEEAIQCCHASNEQLHAALTAAWQAGRLLLTQKKRVRRKMGPGAWLLWLEANFAGSIRTAQRYMKLARKVTGVTFLREFSLRQVYARLGISTEPKSPGRQRLVHRLPEHVVHANKLLRALKHRSHDPGAEQDEAYRRDLRPLFEHLRSWFDASEGQNIAAALRSYRVP